MYHYKTRNSGTPECTDKLQLNYKYFQTLLFRFCIPHWFYGSFTKDINFSMKA
jgi:hypothetical protein